MLCWYIYICAHRGMLYILFWVIIPTSQTRNSVLWMLLLIVTRKSLKLKMGKMTERAGGGLCSIDISARPTFLHGRTRASQLKSILLFFFPPSHFTIHGFCASLFLDLDCYWSVAVLEKSWSKCSFDIVSLLLVNSHRMLWVGRGIKGHWVSTPAMVGDTSC